MAAPLPSALSVAANAVVHSIDTHFRKNGAPVHVFADTPANSAKRAAPDLHVINLFFYRIAASGFHAAQGAQDPLMMRLNCLVTPFCKDISDEETLITSGEAELRILGEVVRLFHEHPVLGPLSGTTADGTRYTLQAVMTSPEMEEINHVWTTQGNDLPYRASAVYEFAVVPVDPVVARPPVPPVAAFSRDVDGDMRRRDAQLPAAEGFDAWSPALMFVVDQRLTDSLTLAWNDGQFADNPDDPLTVALAGMVGESAAVRWERQQAGAWIAVGAPEFHAVEALRLDAAAARTDLVLPTISAPQLLRLTARAAQGGAAVPGAPVSNAIHLRIVHRDGP
jgi:hypothetical protein